MRFRFAKLTRSMSQGEQRWVAQRTAMALTVALLTALLGSAGRDVAAQASATASRSTTIALTSDGSGSLWSIERQTLSRLLE